MGRYSWSLPDQSISERPYISTFFFNKSPRCTLYAIFQRCPLTCWQLPRDTFSSVHVTISTSRLISFFGKWLRSWPDQHWAIRSPGSRFARSGGNSAPKTVIGVITRKIPCYLRISSLAPNIPPFLSCPLAVCLRSQVEESED